MSDQKLQKNERPHGVYRITDAQGAAIRYAVTALDENGIGHPRYDDTRHNIELVERFDSYKPAQAMRVRLERKNHKYLAPIETVIKLPPFMPQLGPDPHVRRETFLNMDVQEQEELVYMMLVTTGRPFEKLLRWLMVSKEEAAHISEDVIASAAAELDLRIAKKMLEHVFANNSPAAQTATMFASKVHLGWRENGIGSGEEDRGASDAVKSLFEGLQVAVTHRDDNGNTLREPTQLRVVQGGKQD